VSGVHDELRGQVHLLDPHKRAGSGTSGLRPTEFLKPDGVFVDVCGPSPCYLDGSTGP
jgi:hypothetical protein